MKKLILIVATIITSISLYMNAETSNKKCEVCQQGYLQKTKTNAIFEFTQNGLEPRFDAGFLKCDHCQSFTPTKEYNAYFSIPSPK